MRRALVPTLHESWIGLAVGIAGGLFTLAVALAGDPLLAPFVPIGFMVGLAAVVRPVWGAMMLVFFAFPDALLSKLLFMVPGAPYKLLAVMTMLGLVLRARDYRMRIEGIFRGPTMVAFVIFATTWAIAILMAQDRGAAMTWGGDLATTYVLLPLVAIALSEERLAIIGIWLLAAATLVSGLVLLADIVTGQRLISTSEAATTARTAEGFDRSSGASNANPTTAATMLLTGTIIALVHAIETPTHRKAFTLAALIGTLAILASFARSAMLVYGIVAVALWITYRRHRKTVPIGILGVFGLMVAVAFMPASFLDRVLSIFGLGGGDWTLGRRMTYNVIGLDLVWRYPIFGVGPGNFYEMFTDQDYRYLPGRTLYGRQLHNMYLSVMVEYGLLGFAAFMGVQVTALRALSRIWKTASPEVAAAAKALFWGAITYLIVSVFVPNEYIKYTWILPGLSAALWLSQRPRA
ncbi:O-antigen ligase family protein [Maritimibacter sp. DP1N21-5]|uniref:O-antigen ligase family protein n=1 Tax=Maritimibacter sp. DP1N21-5 TaxID=2836867 RepID=UPI001C44E9C9|nr:O-antigen ligase family protein [Maritimibacter sp. DP1N21-5]MBV7410676.1 O-antigen ligase family protein [Maritimibacter sp. DP1N21-5]